MRKYPEATKSDVWICELSTGIFTRLTYGSDAEWAPVWSPDGRELAVASNRGRSRVGGLDLYRKFAGGGEQHEVLFASEGGWKLPRQWMPDGSILFEIWAGDRADSAAQPGI